MKYFELSCFGFEAGLAIDVMIMGKVAKSRNVPNSSSSSSAMAFFSENQMQARAAEKLNSEVDAEIQTLSSNFFELIRLSKLAHDIGVEHEGTAMFVMIDL